MKSSKTLTWMVIAILFSVPVTGLIAQDEGGSDGAHIGIRGGVIISKAQFDEGNLDDNSESKFGLDFAGILNLPLGGGTFDLQPEVHWMQKGYKIEDAQNGDITSTLNYMEIPLLLRLNIGGSAKLFAFGGPSVGFFLGGKSESDFGSFDLDSDDIESTEFGLHLGAGIGLGIFEVDVRYMQGLSDTAGEDLGTEGVKNSGFGAGLTFMF